MRCPSEQPAEPASPRRAVRDLERYVRLAHQVNEQQVRGIAGAEPSEALKQAQQDLERHIKGCIAALARLREALKPKPAP